MRGPFHPVDTPALPFDRLRANGGLSAEGTIKCHSGQTTFSERERRKRGLSVRYWRDIAKLGQVVRDSGAKVD